MLNGEKGNAKSFQCFLASSSPTRFEFGSASLISYTHAITAGKLVAGYVLHPCGMVYFEFESHAHAQLKQLSPLLNGIDIINGFLLMEMPNLEHNRRELKVASLFYIQLITKIPMKMIWALLYCPILWLEVILVQFWPTPTILLIFLLFQRISADFLKPIALPLNSLKIPRINEEGEVSGFGVTKEMDKATPSDELYTTYITVVNTSECPIANYKVQEESNFCGRDFIKNARLCKGDTGNAFVVLQRGVPTLVSSNLFIII